MSKETLKSLSEKTGYSISTISRVLSGKGQQHRISEDTINLILKRARELNYAPNLSAQSLRTNHTNTIGLLIPSISNHFFANIANEIINAAKPLGYQIIIMDTRENEEIERQAIESLLMHNVDGIIVAPSTHIPQPNLKIQERIPIILIDRNIKGSKIPVVSVDNYKGAYMLTELLIRNGHHNILAIQGIESSSANQERVRGYYEAMEAHHFAQFAHIVGNDFTSTNGYTETNLALLQEDRPTAIFTLNNSIFLGCIKALKANQIEIPSQMSVVTFDDDPYMDVLTPPITRIVQPIKEECNLVLKMLVQQIELDKTSKSAIYLAPTLKLRESVSFLEEEK